MTKVVSVWRDGYDDEEHGRIHAGNMFCTTPSSVAVEFAGFIGDESDGARIHVRTDDGVLHKFDITVEMEPQFYADEVV